MKFKLYLFITLMLTGQVLWAGHEDCQALLDFFWHPSAPSLIDPQVGRAPVGTLVTLNEVFIKTGRSQQWVRVRDGRMELHLAEGDFNGLEASLITALGERRLFKRNSITDQQWREYPHSQPEIVDPRITLPARNIAFPPSELPMVGDIASRWFFASSTVRGNWLSGPRILNDVAQDFITVLNRDEPLELRDLERWNRTLRNCGQDRGRLPGTIRGTRITNELDLCNYPMFYGDGRNVFVKFVPSEHAPVRMEQLIARAREVGVDTALLEVARLYQEFIVIHPFTEGNGRTARVFRDYLLARAGFPAIRAGFDLSEVLYISPEEYAYRLLEALINPNSAQIPKSPYGNLRF